ncbi:BnaA09g35090D [Brassica napus]|uniref:BnaA09g35090D protein n=1 Tax=Brassica napus TaxID=3708 RepID=A0A078HQV6_BRANA|nr:BnaA09g35090D [Brassica napus]
MDIISGLSFSLST